MYMQGIVLNKAFLIISVKFEQESVFSLATLNCISIGIEYAVSCSACFEEVFINSNVHACTVYDSWMF